METNKLRAAILVSYVVLMLIYLLFPLIIVVPMSFSETTFLAFPPTGFTWHWYEDFFSSAGWTSATYRSLFIGLMSAMLATVVGTLSSLAIAKASKRSGFILRWIFLGPQLVPVIILALGILLLYSQIGLYGSYVGIVIAHAILALPFVITATLGSVLQVGDTLEKAGRVLGATPWQAFWHVTFPNIKASIFAGFVFAFFVSFDELIVSLFVMGQNETLPMRIWADVRQELSPVIAVVATLLILVTALIVVPAELMRRKSPLAKPVEA